jgi:hypothetical protein
MSLVEFSQLCLLPSFAYSSRICTRAKYFPAHSKCYTELLSRVRRVKADTHQVSLLCNGEQEREWFSWVEISDSRSVSEGFLTTALFFAKKTFWNSDSWHFLILRFETQHLSSSHWYFSNSALSFSNFPPLLSKNTTASTIAIDHFSYFLLLCSFKTSICLCPCSYLLLYFTLWFLHWVALICL